MLTANYYAAKHNPESIISTPYSALSNSYLQETEHNSDIDDFIRNEIENKFIKSKVNQVYTFPRKRVLVTLQDDLMRKDPFHAPLTAEKNKRSLNWLSSKNRTVRIQNKSQTKIKSLSMIKTEFLINFNHTRMKSDIPSSPSKIIKSPYLQTPKKQLPKMSTMKKNLTLIKIHGNLLMKVT